MTLARTQEYEAKRKRGRLKIFFGAAPGVGKTYAMLQAAQNQRKAGVDVVAGVVETHGRIEAENLLQNLEISPPKIIEHNGAKLTEFDLDSALARQPQLILIDELAHTNAPGSRHPKRWQDVQELIDAGVNVYTTMNVHHLESLNDVIEQVTDIRVRETAPNAIVDDADEVELIDLSPDELLERLKEGKVHTPEPAMENFFRKGNLIALRELSLRHTAAHVDEDMRDYRRAKAIEDVWPVAERILVCVGSEPNADRLVRAGKRIADTLHAEWIVVSVETPAMLRRSEADRDKRIRVLQLAEELGAETVTLGGRAVASEVLGYARARNVSRIVVGKPRPRRWLRALHPTPVDAIVAGSGDIDVHVISGDAETTEFHRNPMLARTRAHFQLPEKSEKDIVRQYKGYAWSVSVVAACTYFASLARPYFALPNLVMIYLLGVVAIAARFGRGPGILASMLGVIAFDLFFVTPVRSFDISDTEYLVTFAVMLVTSIVIGSLTANVRLQANVAGYRERRAALLYAMSRELAITRHQTDMLKVAIKHIGEVFDSQAVILLPGPSGKLAHPKGESVSGSYHGADLRVAEWVYAHRVPGGLGTTTLAESEALYLPLLASGGPVGVLSVLPVDARRILLPEQRQLLETFASQIALAIERVHLAANAQSAHLKAETERLRNSLLSAISHDLRTPLAAIIKSTNDLIEHDNKLSESARKELSKTIFHEAQHMSALVNNLLDMTRLESGNVKLKRQQHSLKELISAALNRLGSRLEGHPINVSLPPELPDLQLDGALIEQVFFNLLENAIQHTKKDTPIEITAEGGEKSIKISVADEGAGLPLGATERVFDKFYRGQSEHISSGAGLGLAICKAIIEAHGGRIWAENRKPQGAIFHVTLPKPGNA